MKKIFTTAVVLFVMALASYASNSNASISNDGHIMPHTQQYQDLMAILDEYQQEFKSAQSCDVFIESVSMYKSRLREFANKEYAEEKKFTQEEVIEINDQFVQLSTMVVKLQEQWEDENCWVVKGEDVLYKIVDGKLVSYAIFIVMFAWF